jgi:sugar/nucleoside kinase (ribokinase family)
MANILGIGNALVDILIKLEDEGLLQKLNLPKGSMQLVDTKMAGHVMSETAGLDNQIVSGGSACNTIHGLANLGMGTGYVGMVGDDDFGVFYREDMEKINIVAKTQISKTETGRAITLITPDSERTFATYLGAAIELGAEDLAPTFFKGYDHLHLEGYLVQNNALLQKALIEAQQEGLTVSLDMASYNVVEDNLDFLKRQVQDYVDILFANEEEAKAFTGKEPEKALNEIAEYCDIAVVKIGSKGSLIKSGKEKHEVGVIKVTPVDTTGAGDLYAAGFLYGYYNEWPLDKCGRAGALLSGKVIEEIGPKISPETWDEIKGLIASI